MEKVGTGKDASGKRDVEGGLELAREAVAYGEGPHPPSRKPIEFIDPRVCLALLPTGT